MIQTETLGAVDLQFFTPQIWKEGKGKAHKFMEHGGRHMCASSFDILREKPYPRIKILGLEG